MKRILGILMILGCALFMVTGCSFVSSLGNDVAKEVTTSQQIEKKKPSFNEGVEMIVPKGIPVLMYHKIGPDTDNDAVISEDLFRAQMKYLKDNGYHPITMQQLYDYVTKGAAVPVKPVMLTFDDGYTDSYTIAYSVLKDYNFPALIYINPGDMGQRLTWEQAKEMNDYGFEVASHGYDHKEMADMTKEEQLANFVKAQKALADKLGIKNNKWFCYPYSSYNAYTLKAATENGILAATTMNPGWVHQGDNPLELKRIWMGNRVDLKHFAERISTEHYSNL